MMNKRVRIIVKEVTGLNEGTVGFDSFSKEIKSRHWSFKHWCRHTDYSELKDKIKQYWNEYKA